MAMSVSIAMAVAMAIEKSAVDQTISVEEADQSEHIVNTLFKDGERKRSNNAFNLAVPVKENQSNASTRCVSPIPSDVHSNTSSKSSASLHYGQKMKLKRRIYEQRLDEQQKKNAAVGA